VKLLKTADVAERLGKSTRFVADELRRKNLRGSFIGGEWHVAEEDLAAYIEAHMNVSRVRRAS
jgi:hypothetical protein